MKSLTDIFRNYVRNLSPEDQSKFRRFQILEHWPEMVGNAMAAVSEPARIEYGILFIEVNDAVWKQEMQFLKAELLQLLNEKWSLGLKDIRII
jgi:predicted nucleic acid-binding Zn ribbon protein